MKTVFATVAALAFVGSAVADTINVPAGGDIQAAINGASDGDIIQLEAGEYFPAVTIDTYGKAVTLRGTTDSKSGAPTSIIDGQDSIRVLICESGEGAGTVFENLLITGGYTFDYGGGMYNYNNSSPTLTGCTFTGNSAVWGGGMYNWDSSSPTLTNCTFSSNSANSGGGMYNESSRPTLENCAIKGNSAGAGGGMYNSDDSSPTLENCTVCSNTPDQIRGAIQVLGDSSIQPVCDVAGDFDGDGDLDAEDYSAIGEKLGVCTSDINGDGIVDGADMGLLIAAWGYCLP